MGANEAPEKIYISIVPSDRNGILANCKQE